MPTPTSSAIPTPPGSNKGSGIGSLIVLACLIALAFVLFRGVGPKLGPTLTSGAHATPLVCGDAWQRDSQKLGDHSQETTAYFDVAPTKNCFGEWISIPPWKAWGKQFTDINAAKDGCLIWFQYWGRDRVFGPYGPNEIPEFNDYPGKWRISTNCTLRYYQKG